MTPKEIIRRYFGWCPRLSLPAIQFTPFTELPIIGRIAVVTILLGWGLSSLIEGIRLLLLNIPGRLDLLYSPPIARAFFSEVLYFPTGAAILIFVVDYVVSGRVFKRHKVELLIAVTLGSLLRISRTLFDLVDWLGRGLTMSRILIWASWLPSVIGSIMNGSTIIILGALCIYLAYNVLRNRELTTKWTFLLLSAYFLWVAVDTLYIRFLAGVSLTVWPLEELAFTMMFVAYGILGVFLLSLSLRLGRLGRFEVIIPLYLRVVLLVFGLVGVLYDVDYLMSSGMVYWDHPWVILVGIFTRIAITAIAFFPPRFTIGVSSVKGEIIKKVTQ